MYDPETDWWYDEELDGEQPHPDSPSLEDGGLFLGSYGS